MDRRTLSTIAILAVLAFAGWALVWIFRPPVEGNKFTGPPRSDYTLDNFTLDALDSDGDHSFTVAAPRLARRGDDGSIYVSKPDYEIVDGSDNLWKGTSDSAWVNKDGTIMKLEGKVAMHRVPTAKAAPVEILTTDMIVTTDPKPKDARGKTLAGGAHRDKRMETATQTTIIDPNNVSHSIGMKADLDLKTVELLSDVHTISLPAQGNGK